MIHVWYIVEEGAPGLKLNAPLFQGVKDTGALVRGTWGAAPAEGLEPQDGDFVVEKMRMSAWQGTRFENLLAGLGRDTIIVTGAWTNMSVEHTSRTGADKGYFMVVPEDGCSTMNADWHNASINYALQNVSTVTTCARGDGGARRRPRRRVTTRTRAAAVCGQRSPSEPSDGRSRLRRFCVPALAVVLAHRREDVEHERSVGPAVRRMLDAAWKDVGLERLQLVRDPVDDERLHALEDDPELLVRMAVQRHGRAGLEADEVQHRSVAEERPTGDAAASSNARVSSSRTNCGSIGLDYRRWESSPITQWADALGSPGPRGRALVLGKAGGRRRRSASYLRRSNPAICQTTGRCV